MSGTCVTAGAFLILRKIVDASKAQKHSAWGLERRMPLRATRMSRVGFRGVEGKLPHPIKKAAVRAVKGISDD